MHCGEATLLTEGGVCAGGATRWEAESCVQRFEYTVGVRRGVCVHHSRAKAQGDDRMRRRMSDVITVVPCAVRVGSQQDIGRGAHNLLREQHQMEGILEAVRPCTFCRHLYRRRSTVPTALHASTPLYDHNFHRKLHRCALLLSSGRSSAHVAKFPWIAFLSAPFVQLSYAQKGDALTGNSRMCAPFELSIYRNLFESLSPKLISLSLGRYQFS